MANEAKLIYATTIAHIVDGDAVANGGMSLQTDVDVALDSANLLDYPLANIILTFTPSVITVVGDTIDLFRRDINVAGGAADMPIPVSDFQEIYMGSFVVDVDTVEQTLQLSGVPLAKECEFYIKNGLDGVISINATWDIQVQPYTYGT